MSAKLYVGGLSYSTTEDSLRQAFSQAGTVLSVSIIIDKFSGRSKGFGFVEFSSPDEAKAAIEMFNGKDFEGRTLTVNEARPMEPRAPRPPGGGYGGGGFGGGGFGGRSGGAGRGGPRRDFGDRRGGGRGRGQGYGSKHNDNTGGRDW